MTLLVSKNPSCLLKWSLGICFITSFFITSLTANKAEENGRLFGLFKPKNDYTDVNFDMDIPIPQVKIPYPIYGLGLNSDLIPFKTWITINPLHIAEKLWKVVLLGYDVVAAIVRIIINSLDILKLWGAHKVVHKAHLTLPGWSQPGEFF